MLITLIFLGGVYFLEDLLTSWMKSYQDSQPTTVEVIKTYLDAINSSVGGTVTQEYTRLIKQFECFLEICAFTRR